MTITLLAFAVGSASAADDACDVGLYDATLTKLVTAGATLGKLNATGSKTVAITSTPLTAGTVYFAAFSVGTFGGAAANLQMTSAGAVFADICGTTTAARFMQYKDSGHPLPAGTVTPTGTIGSVPVIGVRES